MSNNKKVITSSGKKILKNSLGNSEKFWRITKKRSSLQRGKKWLSDSLEKGRMSKNEGRHRSTEKKIGATCEIWAKDKKKWSSPKSNMPSDRSNS
jgi:hypothetical protein